MYKRYACIFFNFRVKIKYLFQTVKYNPKHIKYIIKLQHAPFSGCCACPMACLVNVNSCFIKPTYPQKRYYHFGNTQQTDSFASAVHSSGNTAPPLHPFCLKAASLQMLVDRQSFCVHTWMKTLLPTVKRRDCFCIFQGPNGHKVSWYVSKGFSNKMPD